MGVKRISRRINHGFNFIPSHVHDECETSNCDDPRDARVCYTLPVRGAPRLFFTADKGWTTRPTSVILRSVTTYAILTTLGLSIFSVILRSTLEHLEIQFVKSMMLHWNQEETFNVTNNFNIIVASDCTFFKDFHIDLARIVKLLLSKAGSSEAIFYSPKRGKSSDMFLEVLEENDFRFSVTEHYDTEVWKRHEGSMNCEDRDS